MILLGLVPETKKLGHVETRTSSVSFAAIAYVTGGCPFAVLQDKLHNRLSTQDTKLSAKPIKESEKVVSTCVVKLLHELLLLP